MMNELRQPLILPPSLDYLVEAISYYSLVNIVNLDLEQLASFASPIVYYSILDREIQIDVIVLEVVDEVVLGRLLLRVLQLRLALTIYCYVISVHFFNQVFEPLVVDDESYDDAVATIVATIHKVDSHFIDSLFLSYH